MSSVNANPEFFSDVSAVLETLPLDDKQCYLIVDAISIRKGATYKHRDCRYSYVDFEGNHEDFVNTLADETFMLVSLKENWRWPITYFLIAKVDAEIQA